MSTSLFKYIIRFIVLVLLQGLILNKIHLFGIFHLYFYVIFLITLPCNLSRELTLLIGFLLGLSVDIFSDTFGIHASATVLTAFARYFLLSIFAPRDDRKELIPSVSSFGKSSFLKYSALLILVHYTALFVIGYASFVSFGFIGIQILASAALTVGILMLLQQFKTR